MILYGAGGHAKVIADALRRSGVEVSDIVDDDVELTQFLGRKVIHILPEDAREVIISVGDNRTRCRIAKRIGNDAITFGKAIHPASVVADDVEIGDGTVVMAGSVINSSTMVGQHAIINTHASVDHDCEIGDFAHVSPGATLCGGVSVGVGAWIGAGAVVVPGVRIGDWSVVGAGSVVLKDVENGAVVYGLVNR